MLHVTMPLVEQALAAGETVIRAESDSDWRAFGLVLLLAGPGFFWATYLRYRNTDKRHQHERETKAEIANVQATDQFVRSLKGLKNSRMSGENGRAVRGARKSLG
jgi:hypothetical protein